MNYKMPKYWRGEEREIEETLYRMTHLLHRVEYNTVPGNDCRFWKAEENRIAQSLEFKRGTVARRCNRIHLFRARLRIFILGKIANKNNLPLHLTSSIMCLKYMVLWSLAGRQGFPAGSSCGGEITQP